MNISSKLMSEREAAELLGVSPITLNRRRRAGLIGHYKIGRLIRYDFALHLQPFLEEQENKRQEVKDEIN